MNVRNLVRFIVPAIAVLIIAASCTGQSAEIEPCSPDDGRDYVNSIDEHVTEIEIFNFPVFAHPADTEKIQDWTGTFPIECVREIEGHRPWVRLIAPNGDAGWTAP